MTDFVNECPSCGAEESLDLLIQRIIDDDQVRRLVADVLTKSLPLGGLVVRYLRLHKPAVQKLRMSRVQAILAELVPDVVGGSITRNGRDWSVTPEHWRMAFDAVFTAVDKGTVTLPLNGNGYLYQVVMRLADEAEAAQERQREQDRRTAPRRDIVQVRGQSLPIGEALQVVHAGKDPALAKIDADRAAAAPMPEEVRAHLAALRNPKSPKP